MVRGGWAGILMVSMCVLSAQASPGAAWLPIESTSDIEMLEHAGPVCLWTTDSWAIVLPESLPFAQTVIEPSVAGELFLAFSQDSFDTARLEQLGAESFLEGVFLLDCAAASAFTLASDVRLIRLGNPYTRASRPIPSFLPLPDTRDEQIQTLADTVDQAGLMADLGTLVNFQTRYSFSSGCRSAGDWLATEFAALGCSVTRQHHTNGMAANVVADRPGITHPEQIVIICGHYDSTSLQPETLAPGADDNGTGSAAVLQAARVMADYHFENTIRFICFSGEEQGLYGSQAYAAFADEANLEILAVYNLDMVGYVDQTPENLECIGNNASTAIVDHFIQSAQTYTDLLVNRRIDGSIQQSDHAPFWSRGFPAFLGIEDSPLNYPDYHKITDTVDKISPGFFTQVTRAGAAAVAALAQPMPRGIYVFGAVPDDSEGDHDGYLDPNEVPGLTVSVKNNLTTSSLPANLTLECIGGQQYITVTDAEASIPELAPGEHFSTDSFEFRFMVSGTVPEFTPIVFRLTLDSVSPHVDTFDFEVVATSYQYEESVHEFRFDADPGWQIEGGVWAFGIPQGQGGDDKGNPDPVSGYSGSHVIGTALNGDYPSNANATITSDAIDCSNLVGAELRLFKWLNVEQPRYDQATIWIGVGGSFQQVWQNPREHTDFTWDELVVDISQVADGQGDVKLRFGLESDGGDEYSGWNIDDIRIGGLVPGAPVSTPTPGGTTPTPTNSPSPTPTPEHQLVGVDLELNRNLFRSGDPFVLSLKTWNETADPLTLALFVILDVGGSYWFWPEWQSNADWETRGLPADSVPVSETILEFTWPASAGVAEGLKFWAAFTTESLNAIVGEYDMAEWGFE